MFLSLDDRRTLLRAWTLRRVPAAWTRSSTIVTWLTEDERLARDWDSKFSLGTIYGKPVGVVGMLHQLSGLGYIDFALTDTADGHATRRNNLGDVFQQSLKSRPNVEQLLAQLPMSGVGLLETIAGE